MQLNALFVSIVLVLNASSPLFAMIGGSSLPANPNGKSSYLPSAVALQMAPASSSGIGSVCTGCRIGPNHFLTAGHCLKNFNTSSSQINLLTASRQTIASVKLKKVSFGPGYLPSIEAQPGVVPCSNNDLCSDLAIFELDADIPQLAQINSSLGIAPLAFKGLNLDETVYLTGAGCKKVSTNPAVGLPWFTGNAIQCHSEEGTRLNYHDGIIKTSATSFSKFGHASDGMDLNYSSGSEAYAKAEGIFSNIAPGDSGGCTFDKDGYVVGVNSHGHYYDQDIYQQLFVTTLRPAAVESWVTGLLKKDCLFLSEGNSKNRCYRLPALDERLHTPNEILYIVKLENSAKEHTVYQAIEDRSFCGYEKASDATYDALTEALVSPTPPTCLEPGSACASIINTGVKCGDYI